NGVVVGLGDGDGGVTSSLPLAVEPPGNVEIADVDGDGRLDVFAGSSGSGTQIAVLRGNGDGTFKPAQYSSVGITVSRVHAADLDADGKLDAIVTGFSAAVWMRGLGDGTFAAAQALPGSHRGYVLT